MKQISDIADAADILRQGGVIAYPTEAVFGLGCDPTNHDAVKRILTLKRRPQQKGMICIAASFAQLEPWLDKRYRSDIERALASWPGPVTWVLRGRRTAPKAIARDDGTLAVRVTDHPTAADLCEAFGGPIVSTSANPTGAPPARGHEAVAHYFGDRIDGVLVGSLGKTPRPSEIRDARTGEILRGG